ncbi:MAG: MBOAT family protein [Xanthobacteraceae bacterium]
MLFNSYVFIFVFLPTVLTLYFVLRRLPNPGWAIGCLVLASLVYYAWWRPEFVLLLLFSVSVNYGLGRLLSDGGLSRLAARAVLTIGLAFNLCVLGFFKYAGFLVANIDATFGATWPIPSILLPIGISFITFQKIAFLVDAYQGRVRDFTLLNYALFVTFFPQLIAGPITHHSEILPQLGKAPKRDFAGDLAVGFSIFVVGLFKKVMIADGIAIYADAGYATVKAGNPLDTASAWISVLSYSLQLYYDFSAYSDMAVGLARMFGIVLPVNFYSPYKAISIIDFWRRWHMTLSRFLRDYLYIPLGGNRHGPVRRYLNLAITMLLGGLWHGANWTFVLWGGLHGLMLAFNHGWNALPYSRHPLMKSGAVRVFSTALTFIAVTLAWVLFRAESFAQAQVMFGHLFPSPSDPLGWHSLSRFWSAQFHGGGLVRLIDWFKPRELWPQVLPPDFLSSTLHPVGLELLIIGLATFLLPNTYQIFRRFDPALGLPEDSKKPNGALGRLDWHVALLIAAAFVISVLGMSHVSPFLYFQF